MTSPDRRINLIYAAYGKMINEVVVGGKILIRRDLVAMRHFCPDLNTISSRPNVGTLTLARRTAEGMRRRVSPDYPMG